MWTDKLSIIWRGSRLLAVAFRQCYHLVNSIETSMYMLPSAVRSFVTFQHGVYEREDASEWSLYLFYKPSLQCNSNRKCTSVSCHWVILSALIFIRFAVGATVALKGRCVDVCWCVTHCHTDSDTVCDSLIRFIDSITNFTLTLLSISVTLSVSVSDTDSFTDDLVMSPTSM